jgi:hypothetical protein
MPTWAVVVIVLAVVVLAGVAAWVVLGKRRTQHLREQFGPEYRRTVAERGDQRDAETELRERERRREKLQIRPLERAARERYVESWRGVQARFVDDPEGTIGEADALVTAVMRERGYPIEDFEQRTADISVDHPEVVENYRAAHRISLASAEGRATTEDLRRATVHYRALFEELLDTAEQKPVAERGR